MKIKVTASSGFCMGVRRAMEITLEAVNRRQGPIYSYGPLIHNAQTLEMLKNKNLKVLDPKTGTLEAGEGAVIIRAHGIPPAETEALKRSGLEVIDATCPCVIREQTIISRHSRQGYTPIIVGDRDHAEVIGLMGFADGPSYAVKTEAEVKALPDLDKVLVLAQSTQSRTALLEVTGAVKTRWPEALIFNTICDATERRQDETRELARQVDAMVVVGGHDSGNTARLAEVARAEGVKTVHIETEDELDPEWLKGVKVVGVTAGASTPNWMIKRVIRALERFSRANNVTFYTVSRRVLRALLLSNVYAAFGAASLVTASALLQNLDPTWMIFILTFFYVHAMHMLNVYLDKEASRFNDPDRAMFLESHKLSLLSSGVFSGIMALGLSLVLGPAVFILFLVTGSVGLLYSIRIVPPWFRPYTRIRRFKDFPASKTLVVSGGWAISLSLIPALAGTGRITWATLMALVIIFLLSFIRSALADIFEIQGDRIVGRETIPIILGEEKTHKLLNLSVGLLALAMISGGLAGLPSLSFFLLICAAYAGFYLTLFRREQFGASIFFEALVDANFILAGAVSCVWRLSPLAG